MGSTVEYVDLTEKDKAKLVAWTKFEKIASSPNAAKREKTTAEQKASENPHMEAQKVMPGCIVKGTCNFVYLTEGDAENVSRSSAYYALNGWHYLGDKANKKKAEIYSRNKDEYPNYSFYDGDRQPNFYQKYPKSKMDIKKINTALSAPRTEAYDNYLNISKTLYKKGDNNGIGQALPYKWEAHHILPMTCFFEAFTSEQREIILNSDFDINHGGFIIFLPKLIDDCVYHSLQYHSGTHEKYNADIIRIFKDRVVNSLDELIDENEDHDNMNYKLMKQFQKISDEQFDSISDTLKGAKRID